MFELIDPFVSYFKDVPAMAFISQIVIFFIGIALLWTYVIKPAYIYLYSPTYEFFRSIKMAVKKVESMEKELSHNGGSSIKDSITKIRTDVEFMHSFLYKVHGKQTALLDFVEGQDGNIAFFEANEKGECLSVTRRYSEITGLQESETSGNGWLNGVEEKDRDRVFSEWEDCVSQNRIFSLVYSVKNVVTGKSTKVFGRAIPIRVNDKVVGYLGAIQPHEEMSG